LIKKSLEVIQRTIWMHINIALTCYRRSYIVQSDSSLSSLSLWLTPNVVNNKFDIIGVSGEYIFIWIIQKTSSTSTTNDYFVFIYVKRNLIQSEDFNVKSKWRMSHPFFCLLLNYWFTLIMIFKVFPVYIHLY
jgi:hypothetical protein